MRNSSRRSGSGIMKGAGGVASIITPRCASQPTDSSSPRGRRFPPQDLVPPRCSRNLPYPTVTDPEDPPLRPERHIENANMKGEMVQGSVRNGGGSLVGLLRCGHCGRKLKVQHNGPRGVARYVCNDADVNHATRRKCIAFGNMRIDAAVSAEVVRVISPLAIEAAFQVIAD